MKIDLSAVKTNFNGNYCYVHARGGITADGEFVITTQPLRITGSDIFYGIEMVKSRDGFKTNSGISPCRKLGRTPYLDKYERVICDMTPLFHKKTGKLIITGASVVYEDDEFPKIPQRRCAAYAVYDSEKGDFDEYKLIVLDDEDKYFHSGSGCCQTYEEENGDILIPFYHLDRKSCDDSWHTCSSVAVMRCAFDGEKVIVKEIGNSLTVDVPRGLCEPSIVKHGDDYFLALRNDETGYVAKGSDGIHFGKPCELCFEHGIKAQNYNTQQHWIRGGGKLYLVYTRKAGNNDHIFRHRAPLFIAEFDPEKMCLVRATERIVVPERGARLGNFGCFTVNDNESYVVVSEWMQGHDGNHAKCMEYGSDNSIFVAKITFE